MKLAYFHCLTADNDDVALGEAKILGYVPETCLLGGDTVWKSIVLDRDPCAGCNGPRERCGGRPKSEIANDPLDAAFGAYAAALRRSR